MTTNEIVSLNWFVSKKQVIFNIPKSRNKSQVKVEDILEPLDSSCRLVGQDFDEIGSSLVTSRFQGIFVELFDTVTDLVFNLSSGKSSVDTRGSFGRVATKEV